MIRALIALLLTACAADGDYIVAGTNGEAVGYNRGVMGDLVGDERIIAVHDGYPDAYSNVFFFRARGEFKRIRVNGKTMETSNAQAKETKEGITSWYWEADSIGMVSGEIYRVEVE